VYVDSLKKIQWLHSSAGQISRLEDSYLEHDTMMQKDSVLAFLGADGEWVISFEGDSIEGYYNGFYNDYVRDKVLLPYERYFFKGAGSEGEFLVTFDTTVANFMDVDKTNFDLYKLNDYYLLNTPNGYDRNYKSVPYRELRSVQYQEQKLK